MINEDVYNNYFNKTPTENKMQYPHKDVIYEDEQSRKVHSTETVPGVEYDVHVFRYMADNNIDSIEQLAEILKKLCNAAWGSGWGELSTELKKGEDSAKIVMPQIVLDMNTRDIAEGIGGLKPTLIDIISDKDDNGEETGDAFLIYRQWFDTIVEFNIYGRTNTEARKLQKRFETLLMIYTGYLKRQGISEILFEREVSPKNSLNYDESTCMRCIYYYIRFESIIPVRQSLINSINIEIGANQVNTEKVKTLINSNDKQDLIEIDFFDGDNGITYNQNK